MASLGGISLTLVLLALSPAISGVKCCPEGETAVRPGSCPQVHIHCDLFPLPTNCSCDAQCSGAQKCCTLSCSIGCTDPVFPVRPGQCPTGIFHCPMMNGSNPDPECKQDEDCKQKNQKCCNVCGQKCVDPQPEVKPGKCPPIPFCPARGPSTATPPCKSDGDCEGTLKCCNSCGMKCLPTYTAEPVPASN